MDSIPFRETNLLHGMIVAIRMKLFGFYQPHYYIKSAIFVSIVKLLSLIIKITHQHDKLIGGYRC